MAEKKVANNKTGTAKTNEDLRERASEDRYVSDFLVRVFDSSKVADEVIERNKAVVAREAVQRGLLPTGDVELDEQKVVNDRNVLLVYSVAVKPNLTK